MKALKCISCQNYIIVNDTSSGFCGKCNIELQEDLYLNNQLHLKADEPIITKKLNKKLKKNIKIKNKQKKKKSKRKKL